MNDARWTYWRSSLNVCINVIQHCTLFCGFYARISLNCLDANGQLVGLNELNFRHAAALFQSLQRQPLLENRWESLLILQSHEKKRRKQKVTYHWMIGLDPVLYLPGWRRTNSSHDGDNNISSGPQACALICLLQSCNSHQISKELKKSEILSSRLELIHYTFLKAYSPILTLD